LWQHAAREFWLKSSTSIRSVNAPKRADNGGKTAPIPGNWQPCRIGVNPLIYWAFLIGAAPHFSHSI
jgi:hypothetical protein